MSPVIDVMHNRFKSSLHHPSLSHTHTSLSPDDYITCMVGTRVRSHSQNQGIGDLSAIPHQTRNSPISGRLIPLSHQQSPWQGSLRRLGEFRNGHCCRRRRPSIATSGLHGSGKSHTHCPTDFCCPFCSIRCCCYNDAVHLFPLSSSNCTQELQRFLRKPCRSLYE